MIKENTYDVAIVGGGLAGLALSIQLATKGHSVVLFEKETYPFHKVCGEYISMESWNFLNELGVDLEGLKVPIIKQLQVSSARGKLIEHPLPLGGFGISRYKLDHLLAQIARSAGVTVLENTKVNDIAFQQDHFLIDTGSQEYEAKAACACYGKRSNIDIKWKRPFSLAAKNKLNNWVGVKYHVKGNLPEDTIALHNFKNGYCGIVKIEEDRYNLCYLSNADNLKNSGANIREMERTILSQNPHLKKIFSEVEIISGEPLTISQISFDKKAQVENHVLMIGDAAGMITPLCGNGMSMALHGSKIAAANIHRFLQNEFTRTDLEKKYTSEWNAAFSSRLKMGRRIQSMCGSKWLSELLISILKPFPRLVDLLVKQTHGKTF